MSQQAQSQLRSPLLVVATILVLAFLLVLGQERSENRINVARTTTPSATAATLPPSSIPVPVSSPSSFTPCSTKSSNNNGRRRDDATNANKPEQAADEPHSPSGKCVTYEERYQHCFRLHNSSSSENLKRYFDQLYVRQSRNSLGNAASNSNKEVVLLRMHRKAWPLDFWLFVCSFVIEASANGKRDVFLYTLDGHENSIPPEFANYVRVHPETELARIFRNLPYSGGYMRGDLAAALFLKQNPQYGFVWMIESDVRYVGSWDQFFSDSMAESKLARNYVPTTPNNGEGDRSKDADLIWWYPRMLNYGYDFRPEYNWRINRKAWDRNFASIWKYAQAPVPQNPASEIQNVHGFSERHYFRGNWFSRFNATMWASAFVPAFGASRRLLMTDYDSALQGDSNENQEAAMPLIAQLNDYKIVSLAAMDKFPLQFYFGFRRKTKDGKPESAPLYVTWKNGEVAGREQVLYNSYGVLEFEGKKCLKNVVFHPVKY